MRRQRERINQQERDAAIYARCLCLEQLEENGHSKKTIQKVLDEVMVYLAEGFLNYKAEDEEDYDTKTVPTLIQVLQNQVDALDIGVREINEKYAIGMRPGMKQLTRQARYEKLQARESVIRPYWYSFLVVLNGNHKYSKKKLTEFYTAVRRKYCDDWNAYMDCTPMGDRKISTTVEHYLKEYGNRYKLDGSDGLFDGKEEIEYNAEP